MFIQTRKKKEDDQKERQLESMLRLCMKEKNNVNDKRLWRMKSHFERHREKVPPSSFCIFYIQQSNGKNDEDEKSERIGIQKKKKLFIFFLFSFFSLLKRRLNEAYCVNEEWTLFSYITSFQWPLKKVFYYNNQMPNKK